MKPGELYIDRPDIEHPLTQNGNEYYYFFTCGWKDITMI